MHLYRVIKSPFPVGPGASVSVDAAQAKVRAHNLEPYEAPKGDERVIVKTVNPIQFKRGEVVGVTDIPKGLADCVESLDPSAPPLPFRSPPPARPAVRAGASKK